MKRWLRLVLLSVCLAALCGCAGSSRGENLEKWDCTVLCADGSETDSYVITYSDQPIVCSSGSLSLQNRNDFDIVVHLLSEGAEERTAEIPAGGAAVLYQIERGTAFTAGCHADVEEGTEIKLMVYDGEGTEPYTQTRPD